MPLVLGIDPGLASTGYGLVRFEANRLIHVDHGTIVTHANQREPERLVAIYEALFDLATRCRPREAGVEQLYFARNTTSAMRVAQARGVALLALSQAGVTICEYTPLTIKQAIVGIGHADKQQVQEIVRLLLGLPSIPTPDHAADALAVAICHCHSAQLEREGLYVQQPNR